MSEKDKTSVLKLCTPTLNTCLGVTEEHITIDSKPTLVSGKNNPMAALPDKFKVAFGARNVCEEFIRCATSTRPVTFRSRAAGVIQFVDLR